MTTDLSVLSVSNALEKIFKRCDELDQSEQFTLDAVGFQSRIEEWGSRFDIADELERTAAVLAQNGLSREARGLRPLAAELREVLPGRHKPIEIRYSRWKNMFQRIGAVYSTTRELRKQIESEYARALVEQRQAVLQTMPVSGADTEASHSFDFRSARWFGTEYSFTANQAPCVKILWEAWKQGTPDVGGAALLEAADTEANRVDMVFRESPAWGTMIVGYKRSGGPKGTYRLAEPAAAFHKQRKRESQTSSGARK